MVKFLKSRTPLIEFKGLGELIILQAMIKAGSLGTRLR